MHGADSSVPNAAARFHCASVLDPREIERWRTFAESVPWSDYRQDPTWAEIERRVDRHAARRPCFFWVERDGALCLTAIGLRRRLPMPGRVFWEFNKGPTFRDVQTLDEWLPWLLTRLGRETARLRMAPPVPLGEAGDDVETVLERHGFQRRRLLGGWATLVADISMDEDEILRSFRSATQRSIRKSLRLGIEVNVQDAPPGWAVLSALETELSRRAPVSPVQPADVERISRLWLRNGSGGTVLVARHQGEPLAAGLVITHRGTAHLPMIPSSRNQRELPASHLLVWEAMRWAKSHGCTALDFAGYSLVAQPGDALWGINQFKRGFATVDEIRKSVATHEHVRSPLIVASAQSVRRIQARLHARSHSGRERPS
jgi:peptidoglycan pentaglycine glycine transferase (the first glycine)